MLWDSAAETVQTVQIQPGIAIVALNMMRPSISTRISTTMMSLIPPIMSNLTHDLPTTVDKVLAVAIVTNLVREYPAANMVTSFFSTRKGTDVPGRLLLIICNSFANELRAASGKMKVRMNGTDRTGTRTSQPGTATKDSMAPPQRSSGFIHLFIGGYLTRPKSDLGSKLSRIHFQSERPSSPMMRLKF
jgi:hypothetical protein